MFPVRPFAGAQGPTKPAGTGASACLEWLDDVSTRLDPSCLEWLDVLQPIASVVFVSFVNGRVLTMQQPAELAAGRARTRSEWLPAGFL